MRADFSRTPLRRSTWGVTFCALSGLAAVGCSSSKSVGVDPGSAAATSSAVVHKVTLQAVASTKYVVAMKGGGGAVDVTSATASGFETFTLYDLNGGALVDGDAIEIAALNGDFISAENGGGGAVNANRTVALDWETFTIHRIAGAGTIANGDQISLQTKTLGDYVSAANGGGAGVTADRPVASTWETFALEI
jgi:mannan endo-1,4-beta-mannosidase